MFIFVSTLQRASRHEWPVASSLCPRLVFGKASAAILVRNAGVGANDVVPSTMPDEGLHDSRSRKGGVHFGSGNHHCIRVSFVVSEIALMMIVELRYQKASL